MAARKKQPKSTALSGSADTCVGNIEPPEPVVTVLVLQEADGTEPFIKWLNALRDREARQRVLARIAVVRRGLLGLMRAVGEGVSELKIDYGAGYRLYFGRKGNTLVVLIIGGDKDTQATDILHAQTLWKRYKDEIENV